MAYQRFVSYIYEYSGGKKGENRGFVRVETKNGICQMGFWLKIGDLPEKSRIQVFGLIREKARLLGVSVGELLSCPGGVRGQVNFPERQVGGSPYRMDQLGGLLLCTAGGRRFATQWDDEPLRLEWFEEWRQKQETDAEQKMTEEADREETEEKERREPERRENREPKNTAEIKMDRRQQTGTENSEKQKHRESGNTAARQNMDFQEKGSQENTGEERKISEETEREKTEQREAENISGEMKKADGSDKTEDDRAVPLAAEIPVMAASNPSRNSDRNPDTTRCKSPGCPQMQNRPSPGFHRWEQVQKTCAHCQPFHDDLMTDCVKVTRQELPQLRKLGWQLDSNQFQNHGLNHYGHFLLCRDASRPDVFFVCVPGMFNTNEQFMAGMFGYHAFRPAKPTAEGAAQPNFGYWCRRIPMPRG